MSCNGGNTKSQKNSTILLWLDWMDFYNHFYSTILSPALSDLLIDTNSNLFLSPFNFRSNHWQNILEDIIQSKYCSANIIIVTVIFEKVLETFLWISTDVCHAAEDKLSDSSKLTVAALKLKCETVSERETWLQLQSCKNSLLMTLFFYCRAALSLQRAPACCENALMTLTWWAACSLIRALLSESQKRILPSVEELTHMWLCPACWQKEMPDTKSLWPTSSPEKHARTRMSVSS